MGFSKSTGDFIMYNCIFESFLLPITLMKSEVQKAVLPQAKIFVSILYPQKGSVVRLYEAMNIFCQ